jgi:hypothetical protein
VRSSAGSSKQSRKRPGWPHARGEKRWAKPVHLTVLCLPIATASGGAPASLAHSAAVYVTIKGAPDLAQQPSARTLARVWLARLEDLEGRLADDKIQYLIQESGETVPDVEYLRRNRPALIEAIGKARKYFAERAG